MASNIRKGVIPRRTTGISEHLDEVFTVSGFFGDWVHMFRERNLGFPKTWSSDDVMYMGTDTNTLSPTDKDDAAGSPLEILRGDGVVVSLSHRSESMPFAESNADFHQIRFYHRGEFLLETELGTARGARRRLRRHPEGHAVPRVAATPRRQRRADLRDGRAHRPRRGAVG